MNDIMNRAFKIDGDIRKAFVSWQVNLKKLAGFLISLEVTAFEQNSPHKEVFVLPKRTKILRLHQVEVE